MLDAEPNPIPKRPSFAPVIATRLSNAPPRRSHSTSTSPAGPPWKLALGAGMLVAVIGLVWAGLRSDEPPKEASAPPAPAEANPSEAAGTAPLPVEVPDPKPEKVEVPTPPPPKKASAPEPSTPSSEDLAAEEADPVQLAIIVRRDSPVASLSVEEVKRIYLEDRSWPDGTPATVVGRYQGPKLRKAFLARVLSTTHSAIKDHWEAKKSAGDTIDRYRRLPSDDSVVQFVMRTPGAMGYVDWARLAEASKSQVKAVLTIDLNQP